MIMPFSILLYVLFVYCIANCLNNCNFILKFNRNITQQEFIATCIILFAFLFVPIESLPPLIDTECGSIIIFVLIATANYIQSTKNQNYFLVLSIAFLAIIFAMFSLVIYFSGIPGHLFCLETYSSPLIWKILPTFARFLYIFSGTGYFIFLIRFKTKKLKVLRGTTFNFHTLTFLLLIAIFSAIYIPKFSFTAHAHTFTSYLIAFWLGWTKIIIIYYGTHIIQLLTHGSKSKTNA